MTPVLVVLSLLFYAVAVFYRRTWGIAVILMLLPSYLIRFTVVGVPLTLLEAYILLLVAAWVFDLLREARGIRGAWMTFRASIPKPLLIFSSLWMIVGLVAALWSSDSTAGFGLWKAYFLEPVLFSWVLLSSARTRSTWRWFAISLGFGVGLIGLVSIFQVIGLIPSPLPWAEQIPPRFSSLFEYPNAVGLLLAPLLALAIGVLAKLHSLPLRDRLGLWAVLLLGLVAVGLSVSEGAILGLLAATLLCILMSRSWKRWLAAGLLLLALLAVIPQTRNYLTTLATFQDTSGDVRLRMWGGTVRLLKAHPIEGAGLGGFPALYDQYRDAAHVELPVYPHNVLLNTWVELGLVGLLIFVALVVRFYSSVARAYRRGDELIRAVSIGLLMAMTALLVHGLVDVPYFKNDLAVLFWFLLIAGEAIWSGQKIEKAL